jgi:hypothetical protein
MMLATSRGPHATPWQSEGNAGDALSRHAAMQSMPQLEQCWARWQRAGGEATVPQGPAGACTPRQLAMCVLHVPCCGPGVS